MATYFDSSASALAADRPNIFAAPVHRAKPSADKSESVLASSMFDAAVDATAEALPSLAANRACGAALLRRRCQRLAAGLSARAGVRAAALAAAVAVPALLALDSEHRPDQDPPVARDVPVAPAVSAPQPRLRQTRPRNARKPPAQSRTDRRRRRPPRWRSQPAPPARRDIQRQPVEPVVSPPSTSPAPHRRGRPQESARPAAVPAGAPPEFM